MRHVFRITICAPVTNISGNSTTLGASQIHNQQKTSTMLILRFQISFTTFSTTSESASHSASPVPPTNDRRCAARPCSVPHPRSAVQLGVGVQQQRVVLSQRVVQADVGLQSGAPVRELDDRHLGRADGDHVADGAQPVQRVCQLQDDLRLVQRLTATEAQRSDRAGVMRRQCMCVVGRIGRGDTHGLLQSERIGLSIGLALDEAMEPETLHISEESEFGHRGWLSRRDG